MKFWQIAAAVLIFKAFDFSMFAASYAGNAPIVIFLVGMLIWIILSIFCWAIFQKVFGALPAIDATHD